MLIVHVSWGTDMNAWGGGNAKQLVGGFVIFPLLLQFFQLKYYIKNLGTPTPMPTILWLVSVPAHLQLGTV